jgi:hypothetical protein
MRGRRRGEGGGGAQGRDEFCGEKGGGRGPVAGEEGVWPISIKFLSAVQVGWCFLQMTPSNATLDNARHSIQYAPPKNDIGCETVIPVLTIRLW